MAYRERLWPAPWLYLATALVIPASLLVLLPISLVAGVVTAVVLYAGCLALLLTGSPVIEVGPDGLRAGRALLEPRFIGDAVALRDDEATHARGPGLDARAYLLIRGWVTPVVRVEVRDERDPAPYWLISSRQPERLVEAIAAIRPRTPGR